MSGFTPRAEVAVPFSATSPPGYEWFADEPQFDPDVHLQLEGPDDVIMLSDLGYSTERIAMTATGVAASTPFRILSEEGARVMLDTARRLLAFCRPAGDRIERTVRNGCYRSRWLRDLCISPDVTQHLATIYATSIAPHPMVAQLGHLNYEPSRIESAVDKWHHDTVPLDYVMIVTDPARTPGGRFEYFRGTKEEAAEMRTRGTTPPAERIVAPEFPGAGSAIALHGDMVVHRGGPLYELAERITMVNAFVPTGPTSAHQTRNADLIGVDDPESLYTEWAKFVAWGSRRRLDRIIDRPGFSADVESITHELGAAILDVQLAIDEMRAGPHAPDHYE